MTLTLAQADLRPGLVPGRVAFCAILALAACSADAPHTAPPPAPDRIERISAPQVRPESVRQAALRRDRAGRARAANMRAALPPAMESANMGAYLLRVEGSLRARGLLRTDEGADIKVSAADLARNFVQIALYDEYTPQGEHLIAQVRPAPLRRWDLPVRLQIVTGPSTSTAQAARDRDAIASYAARLQTASGHPVRLVDQGGNFTILMLTEDERRAIEPRLRQLVPGIPERDLHAIRDLAPQLYCTAFAYAEGDGAVYAHAVAVIRAELPPRMRMSCIHEELAQGMGLANDSPDARPSIFNDDEEFALLTRHDELLLRMLYDRRLRPGMTEAEATPIVQQIAAELLP